MAVILQEIQINGRQIMFELLICTSVVQLKCLGGTKIKKCNQVQWK